MAFPAPEAIKQWSDVKQHSFDALIIVSTQLNFAFEPKVSQCLEELASIDHRVGQEVVLTRCTAVPGERLIHAPAHGLDKDYSDVRNFGDATKAAVEIAKSSGSVNPLIYIAATDRNFPNLLNVCYLSACQGLWKPLEAREVIGEEKLEPIQSIGLFDPLGAFDPKLAGSIESGKRLARDLCGTEPERMAPPKFAEYCEQAFKGSNVEVKVESNQATILQEFPLLAAVGRASQSVERHHPRVIELTYTPKGNIHTTLFLIGKAVTYDTGGADIKVGGHMAGMSRDKGGGAAVAGFLKSVAELQPEGIKVVGIIGAVRNSVGSDCFVADEIITAHSGKRVRIGNTDAEGRLAMCDLLSHARISALQEANPHLFTIATLTGHAALTAGPYTLLVENGPARAKQVSSSIAQSGDDWGDCADISRPRREDWQTIKPRTEADDVLSSNNGPSVSIARGHQFPMAFLSVASGLDDHGQFSQQPLPYVHIDIAGSGVEGGSWQHGKPTAAPITALIGAFIKNK